MKSGAPAAAAHSALGWVIPGRANRGHTRRVARFVQNPNLAKAAEFVRRGAFRNTLIMAGGTRAFLRFYDPKITGGAGAPELLHDGSGLRAQALATTYPHLQAMELDRDILQRSVRWLRVLPLPECGWSAIETLDALEAWWMSHSATVAQARQSGIVPDGPQKTPPVARPRPVMALAEN
jgi:mannose-1-phosphate guanylyltransferase